MAEKWRYERLNDKGKIEYAPMNDYDGKVTGHIVFGVKAWFDEHPEERKRLGWIKHIVHETKDIEYNHQTQYLSRSTRQVDDYTVEDEYTVMDKSAEMMRLEELGMDDFWVSADDSVVFWGADV